MKQVRYIITETGLPTSLDPLDADMTQNLPIARMLYTTPLEVDSLGHLNSTILQSFAYDPTSLTIKWVVKDGIYFSDGTEITVNDVVLSVTRMLMKRPKFPVLRSIRGIQDWLQSQHPLKSLPDGIKVDGKDVSIMLTEATHQTLFRFCMEVFSIIPSREVDLDTGRLKVENPTSSGHYQLIKIDDKELVFRTNKAQIYGEPVPHEIKIVYMTPKVLVANIDRLLHTDVVQGSEIQFTPPNTIHNIEPRLTTSFLPAARYAALIYNTTMPPFDLADCRVLFAKTFRDTFKKMFGDFYSAEASFFPRILPGYLPTEEMDNIYFNGMSEGRREECIKHLRLHPIHWTKPLNPNGELITTVFIETLKSLKIENSSEYILKDGESDRDAFLKYKVHFSYGSSGFWALDPANDLQMMFTPNLHKALQEAANDFELQELISRTRTSPNKEEAFKDVNLYIYSKGIVNVFANLRRFFAARNQTSIAEFPLSVTSPAPWQVFRQ